MLHLYAKLLQMTHVLFNFPLAVAFQLFTCFKKDTGTSA